MSWRTQQNVRVVKTVWEKPFHWPERTRADVTLAGVHGHVHGPCWELCIISQKHWLCTPAGQSRVPGYAQRDGAVGGLAGTQALAAQSSKLRSQGPLCWAEWGKRALPKPEPVVREFPQALSRAAAHLSYFYVMCDN